MAERHSELANSGRLTLGGWLPLFESDLDRIPWMKRGRPRSFLEFRLLDMEKDQRILPKARQMGRLDSHYLYRWEWRLFGYGKTPIWFTLDEQGIITPIMAYSPALRSRRGERALAIARARQVHGIAATELTEID